MRFVVTCVGGEGRGSRLEGGDRAKGGEGGGSGAKSCEVILPKLGKKY